jgi:hypothetical protein
MATVAGFALSYGSYSEDGTAVGGIDEATEKSAGASDVDVEAIAADESTLGPSDVEQLDTVPSRPSDRATTSRPQTTTEPITTSVTPSKADRTERRVVVRQQ